MELYTRIEQILKKLRPAFSREVPFEWFVNLNAIALGLLQVLALEWPHVVWTHFPQWFRTLPKHGLPSEQIVRMVLQHLQPVVLSKRRHTLLLAKLLAAKIKPPETLQPTPLVA